MDDAEVTVTHPERVVFPDIGLTKGDVVEYAPLVMPVIESTAALVYIANQGMITPHAWLTRADRPHHPDRLVFDLDPSTDAEAVAFGLVERHPDRLTVEFSKKARGGRLFVDVMRNAYAQTEVVAYGLRGRRGAPVATPLQWDEVRDASLTAEKWTARNIFRRLARRKDPWVTIDRSARPLPRVR